jgi:small subunit ribosomal protein S15
MAITSERKKELSTEHGKNPEDCGSPSTQVAILTERINHLTEHLKEHNKDFSTRRGLMKMVGRRRRLLNYLKRHLSAEQYKAFLNKLNLRK